MRRKNTTSEMMKHYIAQSLLILMEQKAFSDISIGEITGKAGVNRTTYYRHFTSKEHIIRYYYAGMLSEYIQALDSQNDIGLEDYLHGLFFHLQKYRKELLLIYQSGNAHLVFETLRQLLEQELSPLMFEDKVAIHYHLGGIYGVLLLWFSRGMQESPAQMCKASLKILPDGFTPALLRGQKNTAR